MKVISYILGISTFLLVVWGYLEFNHNLGIPDGYISDYSRITNYCYKILVLPIFSISLYFGYLGWISTRVKITKKLTSTSFLLSVLIIAITALDKYLFIYFDHGQGG